MLRSIENVDEILTSVLHKYIFWQAHAQDAINDRQKQVLNTYLDGYEGKLTIKNWARLSKSSTDTAERDIKYLTRMGILTPQQGKVRNVAYGINVSKSLLLVPGIAEDGGAGRCEATSINLCKFA